MTSVSRIVDPPRGRRPFVAVDGVEHSMCDDVESRLRTIHVE